MNMHRIIVTLELAPSTVKNLFPECETVPESVHQALCLAVHEGWSPAYKWLSEFVTDVKIGTRWHIDNSVLHSLSVKTLRNIRNDIAKIVPDDNAQEKDDHQYLLDILDETIQEG